MRNELNALKKKFKLHSIENPYTPGKPLNLSFMRVSKSDPSEQFFIRTLARRQHKADNSETPAVYAVTGRGRAIKSFAGKKISKKNIEDLWYFLTGPCSCIIKAQNPGFDLLMSADWVSAIRGQGPVSALPSFEDIDIRGD